MAEQLGEARLRLSVDDSALKAGLQRAQQQATQTGAGINQAFTGSTRSIAGLEARLESLRGKFNAAEIGSKEFRKLREEIQATEGAISKAKGASDGGNGGSGGLLAALGFSGAAAAAVAFSAAVIGIGAAAVQTAGQIQKLNAALTGLTGSAQAAQQLRQDLFTLSKTTPFKNENILSAAQQFLAVGVEADKLQGTINRVGALAAQSGQPLERLALIYAQVYAKGRLQGEENLQLLEAGVDLTDELASVTGKSGEALRDAMSKGQVSVEDFNKALVLATGDMASLQQAGKAVDVAFNNIGDNLGQLFGGFATSIAPALSAAFNVVNKILEQAFPSLQEIQDTFKPLTTEAERFAKALEGNPELIAAIAAAVREWGSLIVDYVANGLRTVNNILERLDGKTLAQGLITAELVARRLLLTFKAIGETAAKNAELAARAVTNPIQFGKDIVSAGGFSKFLEKEYAGVRQAWAAITNAKPLEVKVAASADTALQGGLSSKPGLTDPNIEIRRKAAVQAELNDLTAQGLQDEIKYKGQILALEAQSLRTGQALSATSRTLLENQQAILAARRQVAEAEINLGAELVKPADQRSSAEVDNLLVKVQEANAGVRKAYLDAGISLVQNAKTAAEALKDANKSLDSFKRSNFEVLTPFEQQQQLAQARQELQVGVDKGYIREGLPIGTPEQIFRLAGIANQREELEVRKQQAATEKTLADNALQLGVKVDQFIGELQPLRDVISANASATQALAEKDWLVNVSVNGAPAPAPVL